MNRKRGWGEEKMSRESKGERWVRGKREARAGSLSNIYSNLTIYLDNSHSTLEHSFTT